MLDQETLRPVIIGMALYLAISQIVPEILKNQLILRSYR